MLKLKRLKEIIDIEQGRKRTWVAEKSGLTASSFRQVIAGNNPVSKERAKKIAEILDVPLSQIWNEK